MVAKSPRNFRGLVELFRDYDESAGLDPLLAALDWQGVTPHQVYWTVLGRMPESGNVARAGCQYSGKAHFTDALFSDEFRESCVRNIADAYPEKRRLIHVHIQKTAGQDLAQVLGARYPKLHCAISQKASVSDKQLFSIIRYFSSNIDKSDSIYIGGHRHLNWFVQQGLPRHGDRLFTVVRHPYKIVISYINFIIGRFYDDPEMKNHDTRDWARVIALDAMPDLDSKDTVREIASRLLVARPIILPNFLSTYLGDGTCETALDMLARTNIEVTEIGRYQQWLSATWGIESNSRTNQSTARIAFEDFDTKQIEYINSICHEDVKLYNILMGDLEKQTPCLFGAGIAAACSVSPQAG
jgi:hypothetical protein